MIRYAVWLVFLGVLIVMVIVALGVAGSPSSSVVSEAITTPLVSMLPAQVIHGGTEAHENLKKRFGALGYPDTQRGIVIVAGDYDRFTACYILICQIRHAGCTLPIELWYKNLPMIQVQAVGDLGVVALNIEKHVPFVITKPASIPVLSIFLSLFDEILYLDATVNMQQDPTPWFENQQTLFWPGDDRQMLVRRNNPILWEIYLRSEQGDTVSLQKHWPEHRMVTYPILYAPLTYWSHKMSALPHLLESSLEDFSWDCLQQVRKQFWYFSVYKDQIVGKT